MTAPEQAELTPRQQQILQLLQAGKVNKEVARELDIGLGTVKQHIVAIFRKLNVRNRTSAAFRTLEHQPSNVPPATANQSPKILLTARPCVVLGLALPTNSDSGAVKRLYALMASLSAAHDAIFLTRQGYAGELIFGVQKVSEYDAAFALHIATRILEEVVSAYPPLKGRVRGCLTAGIGFASMQRFGGWSGEAIASAAISSARDLLQVTPDGRFACDTAAQDLCEAFGISGAARLSGTLEFEALPSLQWSGLRSSHPLVGRARELKVLNTAIQRAERGKGAIVVLEGEMGMGKSRICQSLYELGLSRAMKFRFYRSMPHVLGAGLLDITQGRVTGFAQCMAEIRTETESTRHHVIVDDFHLLDTAQQAGWFDAAIQARTYGVLTIFAGRKGLTRLAPADSIHVPLSRLPTQHMQALVRQAIDMPAGRQRASIMQTILETSTGVPLFALEMARLPDPVKLSLPLMVAVQSRIDKFRLDSAVLRLVASNPEGISVAQLSERLGEPTDSLLPQVERATAMGVLATQPHGALTFTHPMIRRVIANSIMD